MGASDQRLANPSRTWPLAAVGAGVALGVAARLGDHGPLLVGWLVNVGGPWLVVAHVVGARTRAGARAGAVALVGAALAKYAVQLSEGDDGITTLAPRALAWVLAGLVLGAAFGELGRRGRLEPLAVAVAAEGLSLLTGINDGVSRELRFNGSSEAYLVAGAEVLLGAALAASAVPRRRRRRRE